MSLSRRPRSDRRRRMLLDSLSHADESGPAVRVRTTRSVKGESAPDETIVKRGAGYSQSVRRACQHRLVQFIPIRKRSLIAVACVALLVPALLSLVHYGIFVKQVLPWESHPAASIFDASQPRSLAAWFSSHLWLMCLITTVLTFQLRRHKLDDYSGEYRLWFWLVITCLIGSIDSTTRITEIFGTAIDRWSQMNIGWSGVAIVQATLMVLIGMLGLRLCTELKNSPLSLVLWLSGLLCWAASTALSQSIFIVNISPEFRIWCRATLWLAGLTSIWLAGLIYLRLVYMEAQRRFIARGKLRSTEPIDWRKQFVEMSRKVVPCALIRNPAMAERMSDLASEFEKVPVTGGLGSRILGTFRRRQELDSKSDKPDTAPESSVLDSGKPIAQPASPSQGWLGWRKGKKIAPQPHGTPASAIPAAQRTVNQSAEHPQDDSTAKPKRSLISRIRIPLTKRSVQPNGEKEGAEKTRRVWIPNVRFPKLRIPKFKLPSIRLPLPPEESDSQTAPKNLKPVDESRRQIPGTSPGTNAQPTVNFDSAQSLSRAERKKLKRQQRDDVQDRRAA